MLQASPFPFTLLAALLFQFLSVPLEFTVIQPSDLQFSNSPDMWGWSHLLISYFLVPQEELANTYGVLLCRN